MLGWRSTNIATAHLSIRQDGGRTTLALSGRLDAAGTGVLWDGVMRAATRARSQELRFEVAAVEAFDMAGAALLLAAERAYGKPTELAGASPHMTAVLARARRAGLPPVDSRPATPPGPSPGAGAETTVGSTADAGAGAGAGAGTRAPAALGEGVANGVAFLGEAAVAVLRLPRHLRMLRIGDLLRQADQAGVRALPLVALLGFLMGMILAFQSAIPMRRFGADLLVANLVTISLVRELGPLLSAVILAGRTGSAFAAEIGTMKVNQEVDALITMGLDPMTMLVLPRLIAVMLVLPALALVLDLAGLLGMATVMRGFGFPMASILHQVQGAASVGDLFGGLFKAACFGAAIAAIGCQSGLSTGNGPRAVGLSATAAVVGGIIATIALDGLLALIFYRLNL
ncbi:MAG TPA: ABC transporter permease [Acetobacteraceae bacterium]|jgi:phospholipid/cholesterol/gamma-HCH transport system permease protein|nr:ABC transporter permease [Acetobacteraceae bacterium]